jgi:hypothetical protein
MDNIQPLQILYLEHQDERLYAEVIQSANEHRLWARPLMLIQGLPIDSDLRQNCIADAAADFETCQLELHDLQFAPDMVWPLDDFQIAFDIDFFSLLVNLKVSPKRANSQESHHAFNHFLQGCWAMRSQTCEKVERASSAPDTPSRFSLLSQHAH